MPRTPRPRSYSDVQREIGNRIRWARELVFPNRAEFARLEGIDTSTIAKIESGTRPPSVFNVIGFARRLRVSADYILLGSMQGVDSELAALLAHHHPELVPRRDTRSGYTGHKAPEGGTHLPPMRLARRR